MKKSIKNQDEDLSEYDINEDFNQKIKEITNRVASSKEEFKYIFIYEYVLRKRYREQSVLYKTKLPEIGGTLGDAYYEGSIMFEQWREENPYNRYDRPYLYDKKGNLIKSKLEKEKWKDWLVLFLIFIAMVMFFIYW